jgi:N-acyl-D-aspartate/D-glutamate deacylase
MGHHKIRLVIVLLAIQLGTAARAADQPIDVDYLLRGATIYDGSGAEGVTGDVAIRGEKIVGVGKFAMGDVGRVIDCQGLVIAPGFIDLHNHSDSPIVAPESRANVNFLTQGCTTIVTGNCGFGPVKVKEYLDKIDAAGAGTHVIHLLPHGALREAVFGKSRRAPTPDELAKMQELARQAMLDGAWGMSTGLIYVPGTYAKTDELVEIARVVGEHGGIYASHIRNEGSELLDSVEEAITIGRRAKLPVHISHFKATGSSNWGSLRVAADLVEKARAKGEKVTADQYPYIASSTSLEATVVPTWASEGGHKALLARFDDPEHGPKLRKEMAQKLQSKDRIQIAAYKPNRQFVGKTLGQLAEERKQDATELAIEILKGGGASIVNFGMHEDDVRYAMRLPWVATASDGSAKNVSLDQPHPRSFGTFTRKLGVYAIGEKVLPLAQAIRSSSALPAEILGLADRGTLEVGKVADIVIFDPKTIRDRATFDAPYQYSDGVRYVFVAGTPAIYSGTPTGALAGRAIRHESKASAQ